MKMTFNFILQTAAAARQISQDKKTAVDRPLFDPMVLCLFPGEPWRSLLEECGHAFLKVGTLPRFDLTLVLESELCVEVVRECCVHHSFDAADRSGRGGGQS